MALPRRWWYPVCRSGELRRGRPLGITAFGEHLALFRDRTGTPAAVTDRCPHRNVPLSLGRVHDDGSLECPYHGWRFDGAGRCIAVPGLLDDDGPAAVRDVAARPCTEQDGFVWLWADPDRTPEGAPFALPRLDGPPGRTGEVVLAYDLHASLAAALENHLDVPHTAFLHRGLFRGGAPNELTAVRTDIDDAANRRHGVEVRYLGEPVGLGPVRLGGRGPDGRPRTFDHWDRFFLPGIAQIEYRVGEALRIVNTVLHLPVDPVTTRAWFVVRFRTPLPATLARPIVRARGRQIADQDVAMLAAQTDNVARFGAERFTSTDLDLFGPAIWRRLRHAVRAEAGEAGEAETRTDPPAPPAARPAVRFRA